MALNLTNAFSLRVFFVIGQYLGICDVSDVLDAEGAAAAPIGTVSEVWGSVFSVAAYGVSDWG